MSRWAAVLPMASAALAIVLAALAVADVVPPTLGELSASHPQQTTVWLRGSVNPQGSPASYRFELSEDGGVWTPVALGDTDAGTGAFDLPIATYVTGLRAGTDYEARLVATPADTSVDAVVGTSVAFTTAVAELPRLAPASTTVTSDPSGPLRTATLRARVDPGGSATSYRFEYGLTVAYGQTTANEQIAAGGDWALVQRPVAGLEPRTTYHYRVVATNTAGETVGEDRILQTGPGLPDARRHEQVSPPDKNGSDVLADYSRTRVAGGGEAVQFASLGAFGDVRGTGASTEYLARRTPAGWVTHALTPPQEPQNFADFLLNGTDPRLMGELAPDLSAGVYLSKTPQAGSLSLSGARHLYLRKDLLDPGIGSYEPLSDAAAPLPTPGSGYQPFLAGSSTDFAHVAFTSTQNLTGETTGTAPKLFERAADAGTRLVGRIPPPDTVACEEPACVTPPRSIAGQGINVSAYTPNVVSRDGRRIQFTVGATNAARSGALYVREDGVRTIMVNASERMPRDTAKPATYWDASADGSKVFFTTAEQLTGDDDNAVEDLYRADLDAPAGARLTRITVDEEPADLDTVLVVGVLGASADGQSVYFAGASQLVAGGPARPSNGRLLFLWHEGSLRSIGAMRDTPDLGEENLGLAGWTQNLRMARVTPGGQLLFVSRSREALLGYDTGMCAADHGCRQIYVYDPHADEGRGVLACASCAPTGATALAPATVTAQVATGGAFPSAHLNRPLSDDGRRVVFGTAQPLVPEDRNGREDVYLYDLAAGQLHLISSGTGDGDAYPLDASGSGDDVLFVTRERLVGRDVDDNVDLYDARAGGGFPEPPPAPAPCEGFACRGPVPDPPAFETPSGSMTFHGPSGGEPDAAIPTFHARPPNARQLRQLAAGKRIELTVHVSHRGRVRVRLGGRGFAVVEAVRASAGGRVRVGIALPLAARERLRLRGQLRIAIAVRYSRVTTAQRIAARLAGARR